MVVTVISDRRYVKQEGSYQKNFFYVMCDSDAHFILQGILKIMIPTQ